MKILFLATNTFGENGGIARYSADFITALDRYPECDEIVVITRSPNPPRGTPSNVQIISPRSWSRISYFAVLFRFFLWSSKFDVVICGHIHLLPFAILAQLRVGSPHLLLLIYGIEAWQCHIAWFRRFFLKRLSAVISISEFTARQFKQGSGIDGHNIHILNNAFHPQEFPPGEKDKSLVSKYRLINKKVILTLGRMSEEEKYKGFDEVIEILPSLLRRFQNLIYLIVGDGNDRTRLEKKAYDLGVDQSVCFTGFVSENEKLKYYRLADVFVMPSRGEGFGYVYLEAMAAGVPVIASNVDGGWEAIRFGTLGIGVNPTNPKELEGAIIQSLQHPKTISRDDLYYFSYSNFVKRCHHIIENLMISPKSPTVRVVDGKAQ